MPNIRCSVCGIHLYDNFDNLPMCKECEVCPHCGSTYTIYGSKENSVYECTWCRYNFGNLENMEKEIKEYWEEKARLILNNMGYTVIIRKDERYSI